VICACFAMRGTARKPCYSRLCMGCYATAFDQILPLHRRAAAFGLRVAHGVARRAGIVGGQRVERAIRSVGNRVLAVRTAHQGDEAVAAAWPAVEPPMSAPADLVVSVIGSLGPGGAERQLAMYLAASTRRGLARHELVSLRPCDGIHAHHLPKLAACGVPVVHRGDHADRAALERILGDTSLHARFRALPLPIRHDVVDLAGEFLRTRPRVVHAWMDHANVTAGLAALAVGVPRIVLSFRSLHPGNFPVLHRNWMLPWYRLLVADPRVRMVANSRAGAASYAEWLDVDPARIAVVLNGLDPSDYAQPDPAEIARMRAELAPHGGRLVVGMMRLSEEKRPLLFAETARVVCATDAQVSFALAGDGPLRDEVRGLAAPLGARFTMLGARSDAAQVLAAADLVLLTSRAEGTPNVLLESQLLGVPVVATRVGGVGDAVDEGRTGILCDADDSAGLRDAVLRLLGDEVQRTRLGKAGPAWVASRFSVDAMVDATDALYGG
jgi:glycosyltransferase involved in cell wall biosynthesis